MRNSSKRDIFVGLILLFSPMVLFLKFFGESFVTEGQLISTSAKFISNKICNEQTCIKKYLFEVPREVESFENPAVGYHSAFVDSSVRLPGRPSLRSFESVGDVRLTWFDYHRYQLPTDLKGKTLEIITASPASSRKLGMTEERIWFGSAINIKAQEYWWNFFNIYIYIFLGAFVVLVGTIASLAGDDDIRDSRFTAILIMFCLVGLSHSMDNLFLSLGFSPGVLASLVRLSYLLSVLRVSETSLKTRFKWGHLALSVVFLAAPLNPFLEGAILHGLYRWMVILSTALVLFASARERKGILGLFSLYFVWDSLLIFDLNPLDISVYLSPIALGFMFLAIKFDVVVKVIRNHVSWMKTEQLRNELKKFKTVDLTKGKIETLLGQLLDSLCFNLGCDSASVCFYSEGKPIIVQLKQGRKYYHDDGVMPQVFGRVLQTGTPIWWEDNWAFEEIRGKSRAGYRSPSSIVPIIMDSRPYGAISISGFSENREELLRREEDVKSSLNTYSDLILRYLLSQQSNSHKEIRALTQSVSDSLSNKIFKAEAPQEVYGILGATLSEQLDVVTMVFDFDTESRDLRLVSFFGHNEDVGEEWGKVPFKARVGNQVSPFAVAVNEKRNIFIANIESYFSIFKSKHSQRLFELSETKGFYCSPVLVGDEVDSLVVLLEKTETRYFSAHLNEIIASSLSYVGFKLKEIRIHQMEERKDELLSQFVPQEAKNRMLAGEDVVEKDHGMMVMVDLRSSTKISNVSEIFADRFVDCVEYVRTQIVPFAENYGFKLQKINWDAFYFTLSYSSGHQFDERLLTEFACFIHSVCDDAYAKFFYDLDISPHHFSKDCCRIVFEEGDISRSMINVGTTHSWGIHGTIMAVVCKLEDACKQIDGFFFTSHTIVEKYELKEWEDTGKKLDSTGDSIFRLNPIRKSKAA